MKRLLLWVSTFSFCGISLVLIGCDQQVTAPVPVANPVSDQTIEVQNILSDQAQEAVDTITRDNERQQVDEALNYQQQKDPAAFRLSTESH